VVSHDLRAPLRYIKGFVDALSQLLRSHAVADPKVTHYLKVIRIAVKMGQMIDGLLTLSHVGQRQLVSQPINLRSLVEVAITFETGK